MVPSGFFSPLCPTPPHRHPHYTPFPRFCLARFPDLYREYPDVQARDAVHAAVMRGHSLTHIVTADRHFDRFVGLRRVDPMDWEQFLKGG